MTTQTIRTLPDTSEAFWHRMTGRPQAPPAPAEGFPTVCATVNHSRWVCECPFCSSAQLARPDDPRFWCVECRNASAGGAWLLIVWPGDAAAAAAALAQRPVEATRNYRPDRGETALDLLHENVVQGVA